MTARQVLGLAALAGMGLAGGWAVSTVQAGGSPVTTGTTVPADAAAPSTAAASDAAPATTVATIPNADALPADAGGVDGVEQVLLMTPGSPRPMPPGVLFEGDELVEERYLLAWNLNGQQLDVFRYLIRNTDERPGTSLCFAAAIGDRAGGAECVALGDPPDPAKPGSRAIGEDEFLNRVPLGSGEAYVLQVPPGTTHVVVSLEPGGSRVALVPLDGIAMIVVPRSTEETSVEFTAWEGPTLLASAQP